MMMDGRGDELPVSALPADGTYPSATTQWEKRNISDIVPVWRPDVCIQCGNCAMVCPHAVIRARYYDESPAGERARRLPVGAARRPRLPEPALHAAGGGGGLHRAASCASRSVPRGAWSRPGVRAINMEAKAPVLERERRNFEFFEALPDNRPMGLDASLVRGMQYLTPLFEFSGACAGLRRDTVPAAPDASSSATACSSPTRPAARRSTAATCRRPRGRSTRRAAGRRGRTRSSRTTPSSVSVSALSLDKKREQAERAAESARAAARDRARPRAPRRAAGDQDESRRAAPTAWTSSTACSQTRCDDAAQPHGSGR